LGGDRGGVCVADRRPFDDGAIWNIGVVVFIVIAIAVRPGGVRGPRAAAADDERAPRVT
jgi:hypothetical protein